MAKAYRTDVVVQKKFEEESGSTRMLSNQNVCNVRQLVASAVMRCTAARHQIVRAMYPLSKNASSENIPVTPVSY
jgi:hypothetical protein